MGFYLGIGVIGSQKKKKKKAYKINSFMRIQSELNLIFHYYIIKCVFSYRDGISLKNSIIEHTKI